MVSGGKFEDLTNLKTEFVIYQNSDYISTMDKVFMFLNLKSKIFSHDNFLIYYVDFRINTVP